jgi:SAM-dependent methyltransferase
LSKGPNTKDDPSEEDSERRLRRRRKGGSLRVPSDNVPRRGRPDSAEFAPPASDDPRLAVSVAYAFSDERAGRPATPSNLHDPIASAADPREARRDPARPDDGSAEASPDAAPEVTIDVDVETPHTEPRAHRPARAMGPTGSPDSMAGSIESALAAAHDRLDAERRADGSRYEDSENDRTQVRDADEGEPVRGADPNSDRRDRPSALDRLAPDQNSTLDYPLLEEDYDDQREPRDADAGAAESSGRVGPDRADSVDIPIEEVLDGGSGRIVSEGSGPYAAVRDALLATGGEEGDGSPADALAALDASGTPAGKRSAGEGQPRARRISRAQTMALSDADIEELDEEEGAPPARPTDAGWNMSYLDWPEDEPSSSQPPEARAGEPHAGSEAVPIAVAPARSPSEPHGHERGHHHGPTASAAPPRGGMVRPMTSRDPGDSGEIIDDELIEEIEEAQRAAPMESAPRQSMPPPLDPNRTLDVDPDADVVGASSAPSAPPPPQVAKQRPPPAPSARAAAAAAAAAAADPSQARPRRRRGKPWFEDIFDEDYLRTLPFLTPQATQMEAQFVMDALTIPAGSQVLDVGCGYGRHAMELAARGFHVVGLDSSLPLLLRGADEAQRRGLTINFVHGDMRDMAFDAQFDGAYCLFSTFGYFDDETNKKTAQNICRALKPGARCVFEVLNRDYIIAELPLRVWWEGDGCVVLEEVDFNYFSSRLISNRSVVFDDGRQLEQEISIRSFGLHELGKLLHSAGFRVVEVSGNMITKGRYFGAHSRDIVVIAERRVDKPGSQEPGGRIP